MTEKYRIDELELKIKRLEKELEWEREIFTKALQEDLPDIEIKKDVIEMIASLSNGDLRYAYNLLEFAYYSLNLKNHKREKEKALFQMILMQEQKLLHKLQEYNQVQLLLGLSLLHQVQA